MIGRNIRTLRNRKKMSQESLAEKLEVSRQTVAKWENDEALPDIDKSKRMADIFQISLDQLSSDVSEEEIKQMGPKGKHFFWSGEGRERGQVVIPKHARDMYQIQAGDKLIVLGEDLTKGIAILKSDSFLEFADMIRNTEPQEGHPYE